MNNYGLKSLSDKMQITRNINVNKELLSKIVFYVKKYCNGNVHEVLLEDNLEKLYYEVENIVKESASITDHELSAIVVGRMIINEWMHRVDEYAPIQHTRGILQINPFLGCNCGCLYCFRNDAEGGLGDFYFGKNPVQIMSVTETINRLEKHPWFIPNITQIGINTSSTEAFLPAVKSVTFELIDEIIKRGYRNDIILISKWYLSEDDIKKLDSYENNILLFLTYTANRENVEPVTGRKEIRRKQFEQLEYLHKAKKLKWAHYYRPIARGWNDCEDQIIEALEFGNNACASVLGGLKLLTNMEEIATSCSIPIPQGDFKNRAYKFLDPMLLDKIINIYERKGFSQVLVGDQSCGISILKGAYGNKIPNVEGLRMYDNYFDKKSNGGGTSRPDNNIALGCFGRCNEKQMNLCTYGKKNWDEVRINEGLHQIGIKNNKICLCNDGIHVNKELKNTSMDMVMAAVNVFQMALHFDI